MKYPVIIVGAPRSGTSMMASLLRIRLGYMGHHEGHFFALLNTILRHIEQRKKILRPQFKGEQEVLMLDGTKHIRQDLIDLFKKYIVQVYGDKPWVIKTPGLEGVKAVALIKEIYPEAKIIFMKRRGIENVISHTKKFGNGQFRKNYCKNWANCFTTFMTKNQLGDYLIIDQLAYLDCPDLVAKTLIDYLALENIPHVQRIITHYITTLPIERTSKLTSEYIPLEETTWSEHNKTAFLEICENAMRLGNYPVFQSEIENFQPDTNFYISTSIKIKVEVKNEDTPWNKISNDLSREFILHPNAVGTAPISLTLKGYEAEQLLTFSFRMLNKKLKEKGLTCYFEVVDKADKLIKPVGQLTLRSLEKDDIKVSIPKQGYFLRIVLKNEAGSKRHSNKAVKMKIEEVLETK